MHLDALLADEPLVGGLEPRLGDSTSAHPHRSSASRRRPGRGCSTRSTGCAFEYRWMTRRSCSTRPMRRGVHQPHPPAVVRQAQVDRRDPEGGDDQRGRRAARQRRRQQGGRCRLALQELGADLVGAAYVTATITVWHERPARSPTSGCGWPRRSIQGRDFTCIAESAERGRGLARLAPGPSLRQCPAAADLDAEPRAHDAALGGLGRAGAERPSRRAAALLRRDRRLDPVPLLDSMSATSATRWWSARPAPASRCCSR